MRSALQGSSRNPSTHYGHYGEPPGDMAQSGPGAGGQAVEPEEMEPGRPGEEQLIRTAPYVHIRSGVESFQPIAAAIAMQENLNSIEEDETDESGPGSRAPPKQDPTFSRYPIDAIQPEPPSHSKVNVVDSSVKDNEVLLRHNGGDGLEEKGAEEKEVQAALVQTKVKDDSEATSLTEVYFLGQFDPRVYSHPMIPSRSRGNRSGGRGRRRKMK